METKEKMIKNLADVGYKARKEAEDFLNRWLNDRTKGWSVQSDLVNRDEDRFSAPLAICFN
jgi:hypothetical protein